MLYYFINIIFLLVATLNRYYKARGKHEPQINVRFEHVIKMPFILVGNKVYFSSAGNLDW